MALDLSNILKTSQPASTSNKGILPGLLSPQFHREEQQLVKAGYTYGDNTPPLPLMAEPGEYSLKPGSDGRNQFWGKATPTVSKAVSSASGSSGSGGSSGASSGGSSGGSGGVAKSKNAPKPTLELPDLVMSRGASITNQLGDLLSKDSLLLQQAAQKAQEQGVAAGRIHSSDQAGAAQRAMTDVMTPLAAAEANLVGTTDISNWQKEVNKYLTVYKADYEDYLRDKGYDHGKAIAMMEAQTALSQSLMGNIGTLLNNPEIDFGEEVKNKLVDIYNTGLENNNTILDLGFRY